MKPNILIVEDELALRELMKAILEPDYNLVICASGDAGVTAIQSSASDRFDLILTDYDCKAGGTCDGKSIIEAARQHCPAVPIVMVTGNMGAQSAVGLPDQNILHKPYGVAELISTVKAFVLTRQAAFATA
jgi:CheY-like chemotaxis protein